MTNSIDSMQNKNDLRLRAKKTLTTLSPINKKNQSISICEQLFSFIDMYTHWAVFVPFVYEPDISAFVQTLRDAHKTVLIPQIHDQTLRLALYTRDSTITQGVYGEGIVDNPLWYEGTIDVCLVPGLVFDRQGWRIGHGKGYYDRFLQQYHCYRIGIGYKEIVCDHIPHDHFDVPMDTIIL